MPATQTTVTISDTLTTRYGATRLSADPIVIEWAADFALDNGLTVEAAKCEVRKINAARTRLGKIPFMPAYGTRLF